MGDEPELAEALGLGSGPVLVRELGVGVAAPQVERLPEGGGSPHGVVVTRSRPAVAEQALEAGGIERLVGDPERVSGGSGRQRRLGGPAVGERPAQPAM